jgi:cytosine/adenosine deaminase-related metal-dependent hydrolase
MATAGGAATTPYAERGLLEPGRAADLVTLPWKSVAAPYLHPDTAPVDAIVHRARTGAVDTVMVAGEVVLEGGRFTQVDKAAVLEELAASLRAPLRPEEERRQRLSREIFPHVQRFYDDWLSSARHEPFYAPSSRH